MPSIYQSKRKEISLRIAKDFENGKKIPDLVNEYADEYRQYFRSEIKSGSVQKIISMNCSEDFLKQYDNKLSEQIVELRKQGLRYEDISKVMGFSVYKVTSLYHATINEERAEKEAYEGILPEEINFLKENINEGDSIKMMVRSYYKDEACRERCKLKRGFVKIIRKYPNIVETSEGCMTWGQMASYIRAERMAI